MSTETEVKFQAERPVREVVRTELLAAGATQTRLQARYFDTPDRALASARMALRLRREGDVWVQTLKGQGSGLLDRLEHEVPLGAGEPSMYISRHDGTPAGAELRRVLGDSDLRITFETDIRRTAVHLHQGDAVIEMALDEGRLLAGAAEEDLGEVEIELVSGPLDALLALAQELACRGLWLDTRSKALRGERLAMGVHTAAPRYVADASLTGALRQLLDNASELTSGRGTDRHLQAVLAAVATAERTGIRQATAWGLQEQRKRLESAACLPGERERLAVAAATLRSAQFNVLALELLQQTIEPSDAPSTVCAC